MVIAENYLKLNSSTTEQQETNFFDLRTDFSNLLAEFLFDHLIERIFDLKVLPKGEVLKVLLWFIEVRLITLARLPIKTISMSLNMGHNCVQVCKLNKVAKSIKSNKITLNFIRIPYIH